MVITSCTRNAVVGLPAHGFESHLFRHSKARHWLKPCSCFLYCSKNGKRTRLPTIPSGNTCVSESHIFRHSKARLRLKPCSCFLYCSKNDKRTRLPTIPSGNTCVSESHIFQNSSKLLINIISTQIKRTRFI